MGGLFGGGSQKSTVTEKASPLQEVQAKTAMDIAPLLKDWVLSNINGMPTAGQSAGVMQGLQGFREQAGIAGLQPGDPRMAEAMRKMFESLTQPSGQQNKAIELATSLYTGAPNVGGSTDTNTKSIPGFMDNLQNLGMIYALIKAGV